MCSGNCAHGVARFATPLLDSRKEKARPPRGDRALADGLAVTYFRMRMHTIIGANPFHGPVRDGKAWVQAAMAARLTLGSPLERDVPPSARAAIRMK